MSSAPRCRHIKVNGTQCGSPALRNKNFCFYHHQDRPQIIDCYYEDPYPLGEIPLPYFEDAHSVQTVIRQVVQMVLQKRLERKTASLILYALQIASSNLKRMELEKPQPEQVIVNLANESDATMAALDENAGENSAALQVEQNPTPIHTATQAEDHLPPGTIHACVSAWILKKPRALDNPASWKLAKPALGSWVKRRLRVAKRFGSAIQAAESDGFSRSASGQRLRNG